MSVVENGNYSVLVIEDDASLGDLLTRFLKNQGWEVERASTTGEAREKFTSQVFDLVLADYFLPDATGVSVFEEIQKRSPLTKIVLMTGANDMEVASEAFRQGAADLIPKPFKVNELAERISRLMAKQDKSGSEEDSSPIRRRASDSIVGQSSSMHRVFKLIDLVAKRDTTVLITGESGTGKEVVARAIHNRSRRSKNPFVAINCGAIPEHLLEDELFGHIRGAYTDARQSRVGRFEQANKGTLFLDEIGNMPPALQMKLLRVLEEREFERLGSNQTMRVDVRVLAATNCDLKDKVARGEFREDLYYRLNVVPVELPPLRQRRDDIPLLANHFLNSIAETCNHTPHLIDPGALKVLMSYDWPGNVRELRNILEFASVLSENRSHLVVDDFPSLGGVPILEEVERAVSVGEEKTDATGYPFLPEGGIDLNQVVSEVEKHLICQSLQRTNGNKGQAARLLFLKRTTLVEKLRRMDLLNEFSAQTTSARTCA